MFPYMMLSPLQHQCGQEDTTRLVTLINQLPIPGGGKKIKPNGTFPKGIMGLCHQELGETGVSQQTVGVNHSVEPCFPLFK